MTAALAVTAAVAFLAIVALVLTSRHSRARLEAGQARTDRLEAQLRALEDAGPEADGREPQSDDSTEAAVASVVRSGDPATVPPDAALEPPLDAPAGLVPPPDDSGPVLPAAAPGPSPEAAIDRLVAAGPLWELERLRLEREWADVAGASTPLPVPWDGRVRDVVAVELEIIREVIGTPSLIENAPDPGATRPAVAMAVATSRLATEVLRRLAKAGEEITVSFDADTDFTMAIAIEGPGLDPDLSRLSATAAELGGQLSWTPSPGRFEARLRLPPHPTPAS